MPEMTLCEQCGKEPAAVFAAVTANGGYPEPGTEAKVGSLAANTPAYIQES